MSEFKKGDQVRGTHTNGDVVQFKVEDVTRSTIITDWGYFLTNGDWTFKKISSPLPTEPGLYQINRDENEIEESATFLLDHTGQWWELSGQRSLNASTVAEFHNREGNNGLVRLIRDK